MSSAPVTASASAASAGVNASVASGTAGRCERLPWRERQRPAADEDHVQPVPRVAQDRLDDGPGVGRLLQALELVEHQEHAVVADRLREQARRLGMGDTRRERIRGDPLEPRQPRRERRLEVADEPARRGIRAVERQPRELAVERLRRGGDRGRLAGAGRRGHDERRMAFDQPGELGVQTRAADAGPRRRGRPELGPYDLRADSRPVTGRTSRPFTRRSSAARRAYSCARRFARVHTGFRTLCA